ncbi:acyltransferase [Xanthomonas sp. AmX2]|uniref:acyltransferase family protein n=1 Tax=Xanthomonas sp. TaxID=29446 RepID=UPI00197E064D|nr:acyltransferase [Xanthomonas sp.]MBN6149267.1 acyltransferase [Xanthomonas sp.]
MASAPRPTLDVLQGGRALAALAVALSHSVLPTEHFVGPMPDALTGVLAYGYLGVDFFFVLSGFIIHYVNADRAARPGWSWRYAESRLTRIYIPYWPVGLALAALYTLRPADGPGYDWSWPATLTLLPIGGQAALGVAWTLAFELTFYLLAWVFYRCGRPLLLASAWALAIAANALFGAPFEQPLDLSARSLLLNPINLEFVFGMAAAALAQTRRCPPWLCALCALAALAVFAALGLQRQQSPWFGLATACAMAGLVQMEWQGRVRVPRWLVALGDASYAIYLIHMPLLSLSSRATAHLGPLALYPVNLAIGLVTVAAAGLAYHYLFERRALALARHALERLAVALRR